MFGIEDPILTAHFVGPVDDQLQPIPSRKFWGVVLQREDVSTYVPVGSNAEFMKYFRGLEFDPVQLLISAVAGSTNDIALELLDQVRVEQERFLLNGEWFDWKDIRGAMGDLGTEKPLVKKSHQFSSDVEI